MIDKTSAAVIQQMFEEMGLGSEEERARYRSLANDAPARNDSVRVEVLTVAWTTHPIEKEESSAELA